MQVKAACRQNSKFIGDKIMENENALVTKQDFAVGTMTEDFKKHLAGITLEIPQLKMPSAGALFFEIDDEPHKELQGVIIAHGPKNVYFASDFDGSNAPPDCSSNDGITGMMMGETDTETGEVLFIPKKCAECEWNTFGSGKNGGKACKEKHQLYILLSGQILPLSLLLPVSSCKSLNSYASKLFAKGQFLNDVVTSFTLEKAVNKTNIAYSRIVLKKVRDLTPEEKLACADCAKLVNNVG